jgi:hypothetical protein
MRAALETLIADTPIGAPSAVTDEDRQRWPRSATSAAARRVARAAGRLAADPKDKVGVLEKYRHAHGSRGRAALRRSGRDLSRVLADDPE